MDEVTRNALSEIFQSGKTMDLVSGFKRYLGEAGVEIREFPRAKYFVAIKDAKEMFMLAHESNPKDGWWGVPKEHVEMRKNEQLEGSEKLQVKDWGVVLLHKDCRRGYWISSENFLELIDIVPLSPDTQGKYHLTNHLLDDQSELVFPFHGIDRFLKLSGLDT